MLFLAMYNLLGNALKFAHPGDVVEARAFEDGDAVVIESPTLGRTRNCVVRPKERKTRICTVRQLAEYYASGRFRSAKNPIHWRERRT